MYDVPRNFVHYMRRACILCIRASREYIGRQELKRKFRILQTSVEGSVLSHFALLVTIFVTVLVRKAERAQSSRAYRGADFLVVATRSMALAVVQSSIFDGCILFHTAVIHEIVV